MGLTAAETAFIVGCARATVYRTVYRYEDVGERAVYDLRPYRGPSKVTPEVENRLVGYLDENPRELGWHRSTWTLECLARQLKRDMNVSISPSYVRMVLLTRGCRRGRPRAALRIPVRGRGKRLRALKRLARRASADAEVFYQDEADIDLNPRIGLTYMKKGHQSLVLTPGTNQKHYVAGALNTRTGSITYVFGERKNSKLFVELIAELCRRYRRARVIHLILDNYIVHKSQYTTRRLQSLAGRVVLHFLPPYSPESNVIERLWKQLHDHVTRNHRYQNMTDLLTAVIEFLELAEPFPGTKVSTLFDGE